MNASELRKAARENLAGRWKEAIIMCLVFFVFTAILSIVQTATENMPLINAIIAIAIFVITLPLSFGFSMSMLKFKRKETVGYIDFFKNGFSNFGRAWAIFGNMLLKMLGLVILLIIFICLFAYGIASLTVSGFFLALIYGGVVMTQAVTTSAILAVIGFIGYIVCLILLIPKSLLYSQSYFIAVDNPEMSAKEAVEKSAELMKGNRWKLFCLSLSFIGWAIIAALPYSILLNVTDLVILSLIIFAVSYSFLLPYMVTAFIIFYENRIGKKEEVVVTKTVETKEEEPIKYMDEKTENNDSIEATELEENNDKTEE